MVSTENQWSGDEIANVEAALKRLGEPHELILAIDRLFFADGENEAIPNLKISAKALTQLIDKVPEDVRVKWRAALGKQLRESVDRAKKITDKN